MSDRQKLFYALLASAFLHLVIAVVLSLGNARNADEEAKARPQLSQLTVTIMPSVPVATPKPVVAAAPTPTPVHPMRPVLDSDGLTRASKAPAKALFQSDANMVAGSQLPATGNLPLPSVAGATRDFQEFGNQPNSFGKGQTPAPPLAARPAAPSAPGMPEQTPSAITQVEHQAAPPAQPTATPQPTPAPDTLALGTPAPTPAAPLPTPAMQLAKLTIPPPLRAHADMAPMTRPPSAAEPSMQRQTEKTRVTGGITAPGAPGVDAVESPYGRYHEKVDNLIGSRWQLYLQEHPKNDGYVTILVELNTDGKVAATRIIDNHAVDDLAELSTRAILESDLPPVPDDLAPTLRDGKLKMSFTFTVYDQR